MSVDIATTEKRPLFGLAREFVTPEGVALQLNIASAPIRVIAFAIDAFVIGVIALGFAVIGVLALTDTNADGWFQSIMVLGLFVVRNFYFALFELYWRGQTPGKKAVRIRVIDRRGGALSASAVFVRNLTRDMELFLPFVVLVAPEQFWPTAPIPAVICATAWAFILSLMPLLNRDRMRAGDLIAGTIVVAEPRAALLEDATLRGDSRERTAAFEFAREQLDMYGIYELQVLEDFLRRYPDEGAMLAVGEKIVAKIAWKDSRWQNNPRRFLEDFYDALRARREQRMLFGDRQESKKEGSLEEEGDRAAVASLPSISIATPSEQPPRPGRPPEGVNLEPPPAAAQAPPFMSQGPPTDET